MHDVAIGIDCGKEGAITVLHRDRPNEPEIHDMPTLKIKRGKKVKEVIDGHALREILRPYLKTNHHVGIEELWGFAQAAKGEHEKGTDAFFTGYGIVLGIVIGLGLRYTLIPPQTWGNGVGKLPEKAGSVARALQLFSNSVQLFKKPRAKNYSSDRCESALIAYYVLEVMGREIPTWAKRDRKSENKIIKKVQAEKDAILKEKLDAEFKGIFGG